MALTTKKQRFIEGKSKGMSNREAAIYCGCSEKTASSAGSRLARDPDIIASIPRAELTKKLGKSKGYARAIEKVVKVAKKAAVAAAEERKEPAPKTVVVTVDDKEKIVLTSDPLEFMARLMNDASLDERLRLDAAKALASYKCTKPGEIGKKQQKDERAKKAVSKFAQTLPPKFSVVK